MRLTGFFGNHRRIFWTVGQDFPDGHEAGKIRGRTLQQMSATRRLLRFSHSRMLPLCSHDPTEKYL